jgi:hypothetical protein
MDARAGATSAPRMPDPMLLIDDDEPRRSIAPTQRFHDPSDPHPVVRRQAWLWWVMLGVMALIAVTAGAFFWRFI